MILQRYILRQTLGPVLVAAVLINVLFLLVELLRMASLAVGAGIRWGDLGSVAILLLPGFAQFTIPVAVLIGVMLGMGRLAEDGELVAFAAAGIDHSRLQTVPLGLGTVAALAAMATTLWVTPAAAQALRRQLVELTQQNVVASLDAGRFYEDIPGLVLLTGPRQQPGVWKGFFAYDARRPGIPLVLTAARASSIEQGSHRRLTLRLEKGQVLVTERRPGTISLGTFNQGTVGLELEALIKDRTRFLSPTAHLYLGQLEQASANPELPDRYRRQCAAAWHRRFAFPLAALLFAWLGVVLAGPNLRVGRSRVLWLALALVGAYYLLMRTGDALVERRLLTPALSAWLPDLLLALVASWFWYRRERVA